MTISLSRKRKKELRKLQDQASQLWEAQQVLLGDAQAVAREAGRQLGNLHREHVAPRVSATYDARVRPYVDKGRAASKQFIDGVAVPAMGSAVGTALSVVDAANAKRLAIAGRAPVVVAPPKKGLGAGGVIAILLGVAAAVGIVYAAWQTLRADDELWVADDPTAAPLD